MSEMTTLTTPHDLLAAIPFLIGYHPVNSLVLVSLKDDSIGMAMRIDYPLDAPIGAFDLIASHFLRDSAQGAFIVAYVPDGATDGDEVLATVGLALEHAGVSIRESLLIQAGRYRSVLCGDTQCCPLAGREVPAIDSSRIAAEHVIAGHVMPFANVEGLVESIAPHFICRDENWQSQVKSYFVDSSSPTLNAMQRDGARAIIDCAIEYKSGKWSENPELTARVIGRLSDIQVRDFALGSHDGGSIDTYWAMWRHLLVIAPPGFIAPVASLFACLAYERGEGALAHKALDRALEDDASYSLATLLRRVFTAGWPPLALANMRKELHPKVCAGIFN